MQRDQTGSLIGVEKAPTSLPCLAAFVLPIEKRRGEKQGSPPVAFEAATALLNAAPSHGMTTRRFRSALLVLANRIQSCPMGRLLRCLLPLRCRFISICASMSFACTQARLCSLYLIAGRLRRSVRCGIVSEVMIAGTSSERSRGWSSGEGEGEGEREVVRSRDMESAEGMLGMRGVGRVVCGLVDVVDC